MTLAVMLAMTLAFEYVGRGADENGGLLELYVQQPAAVGGQSFSEGSWAWKNLDGHILAWIHLCNDWACLLTLLSCPIW